ncbi:MAG: zinc ribbon domain-containing protein [Anaerolineae bacterium]|nr:zinc ribbon domain-containing protein [Anaerolineae bacterium]
MPIYEYRCQECGRRFSVFWRSFGDVHEDRVVCKRCGSKDVQRLVSRVRMVRSEDSHLDDLADPSAWGDFDENDPKSMGRFMRKMMSEIGDEAGDLGPEFEEVVDRLEAGQDPEEIEKDMPDLLGEEGMGGPGGAGGGGDSDFYSGSDFDV